MVGEGVFSQSVRDGNDIGGCIGAALFALAPGTVGVVGLVGWVGGVVGIVRV